jgi:uncharacterized protein YndB with AHSA1/START domain
MRISKSVLIRKPVGDVFAFMSEPQNDTRWCAKVTSVEQVAGDGPGPGARYAVIHKPVPGRPERRMDHECASWDPPHRIEWREDDGTDVIQVTYTLEDLGGSTKVTQEDDADLGAARLLRPIYRVGIGRDVARQLRALKEILEES